MDRVGGDVAYCDTRCCISFGMMKANTACVLAEHFGSKLCLVGVI